VIPGPADRTSDFDYDLPEELIAQVPLPDREGSRLLHLPACGAARHLRFTDLPELLGARDLLVLNDSKVVPARLLCRRAVTGGRAEVLVLDWEGLRGRALVRTRGRLRPLERIELRSGHGALRICADLGDGCFEIEVLEPHRSLLDLLHLAGRMPLPPYIHRKDEDARDPLDAERYQTTFARCAGSVAAPTAGLHFTPGMLARIRAAGVDIATVTLHVGLGTFLPVRDEDPGRHRMHEERYEIPAATAGALRRCRARGGRVVAVGTTTARALEAAAAGGTIDGPRVATTALFIRPPYRFRVVDRLLTNFHAPRSTLLMLVSALAGRERILDSYKKAVARGYRFLSYGDACFLERKPPEDPDGEAA
jgi:S-adenosylmethionine:tRNA ribosyltransferase-isomerase